jgi:deoxyadenosine/deoxycytidine kinase
MSIVTIEGNIGSGKSTLLSMCENSNKINNVLNLKKAYIVIFEKVDDWTSMTDMSGLSIFDLFYHNKKRYSYVFQTYVLFSRVSHLMETIKNNPDKIIICERSLMTDFEIFAKTLYESDDITEIEWNVYVKWHKMVRDLFDIPVIGQIYLRTSPENCVKRIELRNRKSENLIEMSYIQTLHKKHEEWLMDCSRITYPTLVIDGNQDLFDNNILLKELKIIENFINSRI